MNLSKTEPLLEVKFSLIPMAVAIALLFADLKTPAAILLGAWVLVVLVKLERIRRTLKGQQARYEAVQDVVKGRKRDERAMTSHLHPLIDVPQGELFETFRVECFFNCGHVVREQTPAAAHDRMEAHYNAAHSTEIDRIVGASA